MKDGLGDITTDMCCPSLFHGIMESVCYLSFLSLILFVVFINFQLGCFQLFLSLWSGNVTADKGCAWRMWRDLARLPRRTRDFRWGLLVLTSGVDRGDDKGLT